jgi:hypothetical protein
VTVAIIDTRIENHPALENVLDPGFDFIGGWPEDDGDPEEAPSPMSTFSRDHSRHQRPRPRPKPKHFADASSWTGNEQEYAVGHGTMVASRAPDGSRGQDHALGCSHRTAAPTRRASSGRSTTPDYRARVINMSFSVSVLSPELLRAVNYATRRGVVCVASAGNQSGATMAYPASLPNVQESPRPTIATIAAPSPTTGWTSRKSPLREGIVTTYLDGAYAVGWGTSFSGAIVSGGAALLLDVSSSLDQYDVAKLLSRTAERTIDDPDQGRVDLWRAARAALTRTFERAAESGPRP